jgi:hypothetical protein
MQLTPVTSMLDGKVDLDDVYEITPRVQSGDVTIQESFV